MPFRPTPVPLAAAALLLALWVFNVSSGQLTPAVCDTDYRELLDEIERNRSKTILELTEQITQAASPVHRAALEHQREQAWDYEEEQRGQGQGDANGTGAGRAGHVHADPNVVRRRLDARKSWMAPAALGARLPRAPAFAYSPGPGARTPRARNGAL